MLTQRTRLATTQDIHALAVLFDAYRQFYEQAPDLALATRYLQERLERQDSFILAFQDHQGVLLGFCQLYPTLCSLEARSIFSLYDLFVLASARGTGVAKRLLRAAEVLAAQNGAVRMDLTTARANVPAQRLYEMLGWQRDEVFYAYSRRVGV